jgi:membrane protein YqaA with SNARE-associated domain
MKLFSALYDWTLRWAKHRFAPQALALLTFCESIFFPIPPDVLLAPMVLAKPQRAWRLATLTTIASIIGGIVGFWLGYWLFEPVVQPLIDHFGYQQKFQEVVHWFTEWGIWVVFIAGFSPIPYKLFTVSAGFLNMAFIPFVLASAISRGLRFFLVAGIIHFGGATMEHKLRQWIDIIGWLLVVVLIIIYFRYR